jgi:hypothetical protein
MRLKGVLAVAWVVLSGGVAPASAQEVLDQQFVPPMETPNLGANVNEGQKRVGQTFTAGQSGPLARVAMDFWRFQSAETDFEFTLRATSGGLPTGAPLATEVLPFTAIPTATQTVLGNTSLEIFFDPAPVVQAGQQYALVVQSPLRPPGLGQGTGIWGGSTTAGYLPGTLVFTNDDTAWTAEPQYDVFFRTYVTVPEPAFVAPFGAACTLLLRRRRERARSEPARRAA